MPTKLPPHRRIQAGLFALVLVTYGYFVQGGGANQNSRFDLTRAVVERGTLAIDGYHANTIDRSRAGGHWYSDKAPGLALAAVPAYALYTAVRPARPDVAEPAPGAMHAATVGTVGLAAALAAALLFGVLVAHGARPPATAGSAVVAVVAAWFGTSAFAYGTLFYAHQFVGALFVVALALLHAAGGAAPRRAPVLVTLAGAAAAWATISEFPAALGAVALTLYGAATLGARRMAFFVLGALVPLAVLGGYNAACFGSPFKLGYTSLSNPYFRGVIASGVFGFRAPPPGVLAALLGGEYRGLLPLSPFLVLAVPGWYLLLRDRDRPRRALGALSLGVSAAFLLLAASYALWHGGSGMGPRYVVPALPFTAVPVAAALDAASRHPRAALLQTLAGALVAVSVAVCTACVAVMPEFPDVPIPVVHLDPRRDVDMHRPLRRFVFPLLARNLVSVKATSMGRLGFSRRPRHAWDAYNLGERAGLRGVPSLAPLVALWALAAVALRREVRALLHRNKTD